MFLAFIAVLLVVSCGQQGQDNSKNVWQKPTKSFGDACTQNCELVTKLSAGHGRTQSLAVIYDPEIDDEIAQWGDCLQSVMRCTTSGGDIARCTADATCPVPCIAAFEEMPGDRQSAFEAIFINDGGLCVPGDELE